MQASRLLKIFYLFAALLLSVTGGWLLADPGSFLAAVHPSATVSDISPLLARQTGAGLLLAAMISLACIGNTQRLGLHLAVTAYLAVMVASHGKQAFGAAAWLWLIVAFYVLPLLKKMPTPALPSVGGSGEAGEVKWFNPNKGFGFITTDDGREIFVHFKAVKNGGRRSLRPGARVQFKTITTERGEQADEVYIERDK
jgi:cold shock CspA family protein